LNTIVESIEWQPGSAAVHLRSALDSSRETIRSRQVVVTVPLGVLHAGAIRFDPEPRETLAAARALAFGQAVRIVLRFENAFWEQNKDLANVGFLLSQEPVFPTWWTPRPVHAPIITGWSAGPKADPLLNEDSKTIIGAALASLERITACKPSRLEAAYFHDWHADPFAQGAYSYVPAGALPARRRLAEPVENTLYFAGEATDLNGHSATVHGAIASGKRAAHQILNLP
jgi:monoamine oxidase